MLSLAPTPVRYPLPHPKWEPVPLRTIALDADLVRLAGDGNSALFLRQMLFWQRVHQRPFYKFNAPAPQHPAYRPGDSWVEELGLSRSQFETARKRLAVKVAGKDLAQQEAALAEGALVIYWTTEEHRTWYWLNEERLRELAPEVHARYLGVEEEAGAAPCPASAASQEDKLSKPRPDARVGLPVPPVLAEARGLPCWTKVNKVVAGDTRSGCSLTACAARSRATLPTPVVDLTAQGCSLEPQDSIVPSMPPATPLPGGMRHVMTERDGSAFLLFATSRPDAGIQHPECDLLTSPDAGVPHPRCDIPASPDATTPHFLMLEPCIGIIRNKAEKSVQRQTPEITFQNPPSLPPPAPVREEREEEAESISPRDEQTRIQQVLEERAVFADSARQIAARAVRQGLGVEAVTRLFEAQLRQAEREQARNPLGAVVWRLQHQPLRLARGGQVERRADTIRDLLAEPLPERGAVEWRSDRKEVSEAEVLAPPVVEELPPDPAEEWAALWCTILDELRLQMTRATFEQWLKDTRLEQVQEGVFVVSTLNPRAPEVLEHRLGRLIRQTLQRHGGGEGTVRYVVRGARVQAVSQGLL